MSKWAKIFKQFKGILITVLLIFSIIMVFSFFTNFKFISKNVMSNSSVLTKVQEISELNTVEMYFNEIIDYKGSIFLNKFEIPFSGKSFIFTVESRVKAGIDLSQLKESDITINKKIITLKLPKPAVTSKEILTYKAFDERNGLFNEITNEDTLKVLNEFTKKLGEKAISSGILDKAKMSATKTVKGLLEMMGFEEITITY